jgi:hypothetical protein
MSKSQNENNPSRRGAIRTALLVLAVPLFLIFFAVIYIIFMTLTPNGTENYSDIKQDVAKRALAFEQYNSNISPLPSFMRKLQVEDVRPITAAEKKQYCHNPSNTSDDPGNPYYYAVVVKVQRLFETRTQLVTEYGCLFLPVDIGSPQ